MSEQNSQALIAADGLGMRAQPAAGEGGVVGTRAAFGVGEIDPAGGFKIRVQGQAQKATLVDDGNVRQAGNWCVAQIAVVDIAQAALALGDQHVAVRQKGDGPGKFQSRRHRLDREVGLFGLVNLGLCQRRAAQGRRNQSARHNTHGHISLVSGLN